MIIIDEAAYVDPGMFWAGIAPLLGVRNSTVIGITTPSSAGMFQTLQNLRLDDGRPLFAVETVSLVCDACRAAGKDDSCTHNSAAMPSWKTQRRGIMDALYKASGREGIGAQENRGVLIDGRQFVFRRDGIEYLEKREPQTLHAGDAPVIVVGVDPAYDGKTSEYAMCGVTFVDGEVVVVSGCTFSPKDTIMMDRCVEEHLGTLVAQPEFRASLIVLYVENNFAPSEVDRLYHKYEVQDSLGTGGRIIVHRQPPRTPRETDEERKVGVTTTAQGKEDWVMNVETVLQRARVVLSSTLVATGNVRTGAQFTEKLLQQARGFERVVKPAPTMGDGNSAAGEPRVVLSGKGPGRFDDVIDAFMLAVSGLFRVHLSDDYDHLVRQAMGISDGVVGARAGARATTRGDLLQLSHVVHQTCVNRAAAYRASASANASGNENEGGPADGRAHARGSASGR